MDILIKGMEMPSCCGNCQFNQFHEANPWTTWYSCMFLNKDTDAVGNNRLADCPLVALPPHGRLIDADAEIAKLEAFMKVLNKETESGGRQYHECDCALHYLSDAPTIVEATE